MDSTRAYQGTAGADPALLDLLEAIVVGADRPDLTLILDLPPGAGLARMQKRDRPPDRFERDGLALHEARRQAYLDIAAARAGTLRRDRRHARPRRGCAGDPQGGRRPPQPDGAIGCHGARGDTDRGGEAAARRAGGRAAPARQTAPRRARGAERALLDAYRSGRMHHGWIFAGERGIGRATLAFRLARFVFAHPDPQSPEVAAADDLSVPADASRGAPARGRHASRFPPPPARMDRGGQAIQDRSSTSNSVRRIIPFLGTTAGEGGWRVVIVDPADDMNRERGERHPEEPGGAAAQDAVSADCAKPRRAPSDHPLPLPHARPGAAVTGGDRRRDG